MDRTHRIQIYRSGATTESDYGRPLPSWGAPIATEEVNLQPLAGDVRQASAGRDVDATWRGFGREMIPLEKDMLVVVTHVLTSRGMDAPPANHPTRFRVTDVGFQGQGYDTEFTLNDTGEAIE